MWIIFMFLTIAGILYGGALCLIEHHERKRQRKEWWPEGEYRRWR